MLLELLAAHRRVDQAGGDRVHPTTSTSPADGGPASGADDSYFGEGVAEATVAADRAHGSIEEVGSQWIAQELLMAGVDVCAHLVRGRRREADGGRAGDDQILEGVQDQLGTDEVDFEHSAGITHRGRDTRGVGKGPQRPEVSGHLGEGIDGHRIRHVTRDADGALDARCGQIGRDDDIGQPAQALHTGSAHAAGSSGHDSRGHHAAPFVSMHL